MIYRGARAGEPEAASGEKFHMLDETKRGQKWIEETIKQSSSVDVEIQWALDDDWGPPRPSGLSIVKPFYRVAVVTPEGQRGTERIRRGDIEDCAYDHNAEVRQRVGQQLLNLLRRLGIAK